MSRLFGFFGTDSVNLSCVDTGETVGSSEKIDSDGWGIGFFKNDASFLFKKASRSSGGNRIANIAEVVSSHVFISHLRFATIGERKEANTQPFRWGSWIFAHQGTVEHFRKIKPRIARKLPQAYKKLIRGNTDSEYLFYLFLSLLREKGSIKKGEINRDDAITGMKDLGEVIEEFCDEAEVEKYPTMNILVSNGEYFIAARNGSPLYYRLMTPDMEKDTVFKSSETGLSYELQNLTDDISFALISSDKFSDSEQYIEISNNTLFSVDSSITPEMIEWVEQK